MLSKYNNNVEFVLFSRILLTELLVVFFCFEKTYTHTQSRVALSAAPLLPPAGTENATA